MVWLMQDKPAKTEMCPSQLAILYCFSSGEQINFSGFSLRPSFLPKSFPEGFGLKLERSYESALCYELHSNSLWNCPFLSLGTHQSENFSEIYHTLRTGHLGTWFKFQVLPADDVWGKKRIEERQAVSNPQMCFFGNGFYVTP